METFVLFTDGMNWLTKSRESHVLESLPSIVRDGPASDSGLFRRAPAHELARLNQLGTLVELPAGTRVLTQDGLGSQCFVVLDGQLDVERDGEVIASITPGYFGGEMSILAHERRNANVVAAQDSVAYVMGRGDFQTLMATCPKIRDQVQATAGVRTAQ